MIPSMHSTRAVPVVGGAKQSQRSSQPAMMHTLPFSTSAACKHDT